MSFQGYERDLRFNQENPEENELLTGIFTSQEFHERIKEIRWRHDEFFDKTFSGEVVPPPGELSFSIIKSRCTANVYFSLVSEGEFDGVAQKKLTFPGLPPEERKNISLLASLHTHSFIDLVLCPSAFRFDERSKFKGKGDLYSLWLTDRLLRTSKEPGSIKIICSTGGRGSDIKFLFIQEGENMMLEHDGYRAIAVLEEIQEKLYLTDNQPEILKILSDAGYKVEYFQISPEKVENGPLFSQDHLERLKIFL